VIKRCEDAGNRAPKATPTLAPMRIAMTLSSVPEPMKEMLSTFGTFNSEVDKRIPSL
jgi:hypothetical protein